MAERLARAERRPITFLATAQGLDAEMADRISAHQRSRPGDWALVEEPRLLGEALATIDPHDTVIVDCLTLWVSNRYEDDRDTILADATAVADAAAARPGNTIVVTNEVGDGIVPVSAMAREYRDTLGWVNQVFAARAEHVYLVVAGRVLPLMTMDDLDV